MPSRLARILAIPLVLALCCAALARDGDGKDDKATTVTIKDRKFNPPTLTVKAGQTVTWVNKDDHDHTVEEDREKDGFDSGNLSGGDTFRHEFPKPGKYKYACSYHPRMKGTIVVVAEE